MTAPTPDEPGLHVVPDPDEDPTALEFEPEPEGVDAEAGQDASDPLLARAQRIADLPLSERPAAFDGLNRALVAELQTLEEG